MSWFTGTLYLKLNQKYMPEGFFSNTYPLSGTLYQDQNLTTVFNASAYPYIYVRMFKQLSIEDLLNIQASWVSQSGGTFQVYLTKGKLPVAGIYKVKVELWDANPPVNEEVSSYPVDFSVIRNPSI